MRLSPETYGNLQHFSWQYFLHPKLLHSKKLFSLYFSPFTMKNDKTFRFLENEMTKMNRFVVKKGVLTSLIKDKRLYTTSPVAGFA
jgi:hypothetical protein